MPGQILGDGEVVGAVGAAGRARQQRERAERAAACAQRDAHARLGEVGPAAAGRPRGSPAPARGPGLGPGGMPGPGVRGGEARGRSPRRRGGRRGTSRRARARPGRRRGAGPPGSWGEEPRISPARARTSSLRWRSSASAAAARSAASRRSRSSPASAALADVEQVALDVERAAVVVAHGHGLVVHPDDAPVAREHPVLAAQRPRAGGGGGDLGRDALAVVLVHELEEQVRLREPLLGRVAEDRGDLGADVERRLRARRAGGRR